MRLRKHRNTSRLSPVIPLIKSETSSRTGIFGDYLNCGQEIGANRLTAVPWSHYCITCQELIVEQG